MLVRSLGVALAAACLLFSVRGAAQSSAESSPTPVSRRSNDATPSVAFVETSPLPLVEDASESLISSTPASVDYAPEQTPAPSYGRYLAITLGGQFVGALIGGTLALIGSVATGCTGPWYASEGWIAGYTCSAGYAAAAAMGAIGGALLGGGVAQLGASSIRGEPMAGVRALGVSMTLVASYATTALLMYGGTEELTAALGVAGALTLLIEFFALPSLRPAGVSMQASVSPTDGGAMVSVGGAF